LNSKTRGDVRSSRSTAGVVDTGGKNLPPMSFTPVVHLDLQISPRILETKFEVTLILFSGAWGKMIDEKQPEKKIS
jgi:hypothetical protein